MRNALILMFLILFAAAGYGQTLPQGKWRLESYEFGAKLEHPLDNREVTLNVAADGKLGGSSGCNAYGGSYSFEKGKLWIGDIISTMRACEEPTPEFEKAFFAVLENAVDAKVINGKLVIADKAGTHVLRFVPQAETKDLK